MKVSLRFKIWREPDLSDDYRMDENPVELVRHGRRVSVRLPQQSLLVVSPGITATTLVIVALLRQ